MCLLLVCGFARLGGACAVRVWSCLRECYWRVVGEGVFPPFLLPLGVPLGWGKRKVEAWGECLVFFFLCGECGRLWL